MSAAGWGEASGDILLSGKSIRFYVDKGMVFPEDLPEEIKPTLLKLADLNQRFNEEMTTAIWGKPAPSVPSA